MKTGDIFEVVETFKFSNHLARKGVYLTITRMGSCWVKFKLTNKPTYEFCVNLRMFKNFVKSGKVRKVNGDILIQGKVSTPYC